MAIDNTLQQDLMAALKWQPSVIAAGAGIRAVALPVADDVCVIGTDPQPQGGASAADT